MSNTRKVSLNKTKKAEEVPSLKESRAETMSERPQRQRLHGHRDILTVMGKDPDYEYRFIKDVCSFTTKDDGSEHMRPGNRVMRFQAAGWQFVESDEVEVGETSVYKTSNVGSIVRIPAGGEDFLYLMKIHKDWYEEDQALKQKEILDAEKSLTEVSEDYYGSVKIM